MSLGPSTPRPRAPRLRAALVVGVLAVALLPALAAPPAALAASPVTPVFATGIDAPADYQGQTLCSPATKVGARKLANLLLATYGSASIGIGRACSIGGTSEHKEGRALDWMLSARVPAQKAKVVAFLRWLLAPDAAGNQAAMARRLGVMYLGWNNQFWAGYDSTAGWTDLKGCTTDPAKKASSYDTYCHRNHLHISLSWDGASALTSFWTGTPLAESCTAPWGGSSSSAGAGTDLVPVTPVRVADTRTGAGLGAPCRLASPQSWDGSHHDLVVPVAGVGAVPETGVAAVAVRVTVTRPSAPTPTVSAGSTASARFLPVVTSLSSLSYASTTVVPVADDGTIRFRVDRGAADLTVDVVAYSLVAAPIPGPIPTPGPGPAPVAVGGTAHATPTTLVYSGRTPLAPGETRTVRLAGIGGIPTTDLAGLDLTLTTGVTPVPELVGVMTASGKAFLGAVRTSPRVARSTQVLVPTATGEVVLRNTGSRPVTARLELRGWFSGVPTVGGSTLTLLAAPATVVDTTAGVGLTGAMSGTASRYAQVTGTAAPLGTRTVLLQVSARGGSTDGTLVLGSSTAVSAVSFTAGQWAHEVVLMQLTSSGRLAVRTSSPGAQVRITLLAQAP